MLPNSLYQVRHKQITAGLVLHKGKVVACAPVLRKRLAYWLRNAVYVGPDPQLPSARRWQGFT